RPWRRAAARWWRDRARAGRPFDEKPRSAPRPLPRRSRTPRCDCRWRGSALPRRCPVPPGRQGSRAACPRRPRAAPAPRGARCGARGQPRTGARSRAVSALEEHARPKGGEEDAEARNGEVGGAPAMPVADGAAAQGSRIHEPHDEGEQREGIADEVAPPRLPRSHEAQGEAYGEKGKGCGEGHEGEAVEGL